MPKTRKVIALILTSVLLVSCTLPSFSASAVDMTQTTTQFKFGKAVTETFSAIANGLIGLISTFVPGANMEKYSEYEYSPVVSGTGKFSDTATADSWKAGYSSASVIPDDFLSDGTDYRLAGFFNQVKATGALDDQRIAAVALDAGSGIVLFYSLDGFGFTSKNVELFRKAVLAQATAAGYNVKGINITCSHAHYCIDTHGLGTDIFELLKFAFTNFSGKPYSSVNETFLSNLIEKGVSTGLEAMSAMQSGSLYFGTADAEDIMYDKQLPSVFDSNINQIKFVPDNESANEIWLVNMGVHPTTLPRETTQVSADYPGFIVRTAKEKYGADVAFFQGAQAAISRSTNTLNLPADLTSYETCAAYAGEVVKRLASIDNYVSLEPILNLAYKDVIINVTNNLMVFCCKIQFVNNKCLRDGLKYYAVSEVGYCELGKSLAIALMPGEMSPELMFGGTRTAEESWSGEDWTLPAVKDIVGSRKLIAFGLTNDQVGYVVPDNDYANTFANVFGDKLGDRNDHYEEMLSLGENEASTIINAYIELIDSVR